MGCRQQEQRPEENDIYIFFHKMEKETEFNYTIEDYEKNYDKISKLSKNKFKKLEKKQSVRIGFVSEIMKTLSKLNISEREDRITRKILFYTLVLTLTLKNFLKENENNSYIKSNNDLQQSLLTMAIQTLENKFDNIQNLKLIIYYIAKMLVLLFKEMNDIDQYINIEKYIKKLNSVTEQENALEEKEVYPFIKVNLSCLGEYFFSNYKENNLKLNSINILTNYFIIVIFSKTSFISENYDIYKKEIFSENYLFNINEQINLKNKNYEMANRKKTIASIKNIDNIIKLNKEIKNKNKNEENTEEDNVSNIRKDQNFIDLIEINESFYYFFKSVVHDISGGKNIFEIFIYHINDFVTKKGNDMRVNTKIPDFQKTNEILLLLFFVKCKINNENVIIYSFLEFELEKIKESLKNKEFFYNFVMIFFELFKDEKDIYDKNLKLLSKIFIIEIEKIKDEEYLIEKILNFAEPFEMNDRRLGLFISFLVNIYYILREAQNENFTKNVLEKINEILDKLNNIDNDKKTLEDIKSSDSNSYSYTKNKIIKSILNKEEFDIILKYSDLIKNKNEKNKKQNNDLFNSYLNFFVNFLIFIDSNFSFKEVYNDISIRKHFYQKFFSLITKLEIISINEDDLFINELLTLVKILINIIQKNTYNYFFDFEIVYKYLNHNLYKISKVDTEDIDILDLKLIYSILIFIITQLKKIFRIPSSMLKLHREIIQELCKNNNNYINILNNIEIGDYQSTKNLNDKYTNNFYKNLINEFSDTKNDNNGNKNNNIYLSNVEFKHLIDIIHNRLFGKNSPLIIYFKSQGNKLKENENENYKYLKNRNVLNNKEEEDSQLDILKNIKNYNFEDFDNIAIEEEKNANDTILITVNESNILDMSLRDKKNKSGDDEDDESETMSKYSDTYSQNINIPDKDEDEISNKIEVDNRKIDNSFREEISIYNFKV